MQIATQQVKVSMDGANSHLTPIRRLQPRDCLIREIRLLTSHLTPVRRLQHKMYPPDRKRADTHILRLYADCNSKDVQNYKMPARILCAGFQTVHAQFTLPRVSTTFRGKNYAYCLDSRTMSCPDLVRTSQLFCGSFRFALHF